MNSFCIVGDLHVAVNNINSVQCCHGNDKLGSLCTVVKVQNIQFYCQQCKRTYVCMQSAPYFCSAVRKFRPRAHP